MQSRLLKVGLYVQLLLNPTKNRLLLTSYSAQEPILPKDKVGISTPLAVTNSSTAGQPYLFYASQIPSQKVMLYNNSKLSEVSKHYSGTMFGAITFNGKVYLFHKPLEHTVEVWTRVYDGNTWKLGARVIA